MFFGPTYVKRQSKKMASFLFSTESVVRSRAAKTLRDPQLHPKIDFRNTIISLTFNLGADILVGADFVHVYNSRDDPRDG